MATTARALGKFRRELEAEGFRPDVVNELGYIMARSLIDETVILDHSFEREPNAGTDWAKLLEPGPDSLWKLPPRHAQRAGGESA